MNRETNTVSTGMAERAEATAPPPELAGSSDLTVRRAERQQELLARVLAEPDPRAAAIGSAVAELLEFLPLLKTAATQVAVATSDPEQRLAKLQSPLQLYANI